MSFFKDLRKLLEQNVREYGMYIALFVIMAIFTITTNKVFISSRNISNLINQTGYVAVLAVAMTLVIVIRHIDLSVGYLSGFLGAIAAIAMADPRVISTGMGLPVGVAILIVLVLGILAGVIIAFLVADLGIPAFVATLAGWLGYRGALQLVTAGTGTIIINNQIFNALSNDFIPDIPNLNFLPGVHKLTLILGALAIILLIIMQIRNRKAKQAYSFEVLPMDMFVLQIVLLSVLLAAITWIMAGYNGLSWTVIIVVAVVGIYDFITSQTILGRHIYAVGGNPEAAELSGISVRKITYMVFGSMGLMSALSGILYASRFKSATTTAGAGLEFDAITAAFIGGTSPAGGIGKVVGTLIGALVMGSLSSGMNLMGIDISIQYIVKAIVLAVAVIFDVATRSRGK
jgi:putative multiple sugar transport system permease protein